MYKLKKGLNKLSADDLRRISVLLESLTINNITKIYYELSKKSLMKIVNKLRHKNHSNRANSSKTIAKLLNTTYNNFTFQRENKNVSLFFDLIQQRLEEKNKYTHNNIYYNMINTASKLYLLPDDITPGEKADLISKNSYITVLRNLRKIINSLSKDQLKDLEKDLDYFLIKINSDENSTLEEVLKLENLIAENVLKYITKENTINNILNYNSIPKIIIKTVNTMIKTLCQRDIIFTQINFKSWTYILFRVNSDFYWLLDVSPIQIIKGSKQLTQELFSMIIFLAKVLLDESYLPLENQLPSYNLNQNEKDTLMKRSERLITLSSQLEQTKSKIVHLENKIDRTLNIIQTLISDKNSAKEIITLEEKNLIDLKIIISSSKEKLIRLTRSYDELHFKITSNPRVKNKLVSLKKSCDALNVKINTAKKEINKKQKIIAENKILSRKLEDELLIRNTEVSKFKIKAELLRKKITEYEQEKHQLKESQAFYFAIHWGNYFSNFKISSEIYDSLLNYSLESLLLIEKALVELHESSNPRAIGYITKEEGNNFLIRVTKKNTTLCHIFYKVDEQNRILLKQIVD